MSGVSTRYHFHVFWSEEDQEWVATCDEQPFMSSLNLYPAVALRGLITMLEDVDKEDE